jgi:hypothetical protein
MSDAVTADAEVSNWIHKPLMTFRLFQRRGMSGRQSAATFSSAHSRRSRQEEAIVRRRNAEYDRQQLWSGVTRYFHTWDVQSSKHSDWASPRYYNHRSV